jgi:hypothetical protein
MHLSSETVGSLAAALARAQQEVVNPEKSLTAVIPGTSQREKARTFRYASLARGLEVVRKSLGRQEIAAMQTTAIDREVGLVRLTTLLAHSSGEWVSSEWPVCPVADAADPQRMGAALTYARRYALFTLVGIAGEDDLDAPEAIRPIGASANGSGSGAIRLAKSNGRGNEIRKHASRPAGQLLAAEESLALRETLLGELGDLTSTEGLTEWALRRLPAKNALQDKDARAVELAFQARLDASPQGNTADDASPGPSATHESEAGPADLALDDRFNAIKRDWATTATDVAQAGPADTAVGSTA